MDNCVKLWDVKGTFHTEEDEHEFNLYVCPIFLSNNIKENNKDNWPFHII